MRKSVLITVSVVAAVVVATGLGVLIWWLVDGRYDDADDSGEVTPAPDPGTTLPDAGTTVPDATIVPDVPYDTIELQGDGFGPVPHSAAFTRISNTGDLFWLFYPYIGTATAPTNRPLIVWLDGLTGLPPSLLANFGMIGPYDMNMNVREDSWVEDANLLFIDAPLGTGFSTAESTDKLAKNLDETTDHLVYVLESFYSLNEGYRNSPLYIFGEGHGAQYAVSLAGRLYNVSQEQYNLKGIALGNGLISPTSTLLELGEYLEQMGYIDGDGKILANNYVRNINGLFFNETLGDAFDEFMNLDLFINQNAGTYAMNLGRIIDKLEQTTVSDNFGKLSYLQSKLGLVDLDIKNFMETQVAPALGISNANYDSLRESALTATRDSFLIPVVDQVNHLLQNTDIQITIYNGNLDAVSTTPGQLVWIDNLEWATRDEFLQASRQTFAVNGLIEGYYKTTDRLQFFWMNAAGQSVPLDSPVAAKRLAQFIVGL